MHTQTTARTEIQNIEWKKKEMMTLRALVLYLFLVGFCWICTVLK